MAGPIFVLETTSAWFREVLSDRCSKLAPTRTFASAPAARRAMLDASPSVFIVGGAPLDPGAASVLEEAVRLGIPSFASVSATDLQRVLQLGARDTCPRSEAGVDALLPRIRSFACSPPRSPRPKSVKPVVPRAQTLRAAASANYHLIALGASTGGPEAIAQLLAELPVELPGIVVVQHMPGGQTGAFAARLDQETPWKVREARDGDRLERGLALIAPGGLHIRLQTAGLGLRVSAHGMGTRHVPSVDEFFESVASELGRCAIGVLLTGMGDDGAQGLLAMRRAGAHTYAQDEASCAVFGMPRRAIELHAAREVLGLAELPERIAAQCATPTAGPMR